MCENGEDLEHVSRSSGYNMSLSAENQMNFTSSSSRPYTKLTQNNGDCDGEKIYHSCVPTKTFESNGYSARRSTGNGADDCMERPYSYLTNNNNTISQMCSEAALRRKHGEANGTMNGNNYEHQREEPYGHSNGCNGKQVEDRPVENSQLKEDYPQQYTSLKRASLPETIISRFADVATNILDSDANAFPVDQNLPTMKSNGVAKQRQADEEEMATKKESLLDSIRRRLIIEMEKEAARYQSASSDDDLSLCNTVWRFVPPGYVAEKKDKSSSTKKSQDSIQQTISSSQFAPLDDRNSAMVMSTPDLLNRHSVSGSSNQTAESSILTTPNGSAQSSLISSPDHKNDYCLPRSAMDKTLSILQKKEETETGRSGEHKPKDDICKQIHHGPIAKQQYYEPSSHGNDYKFLSPPYHIDDNQAFFKSMNEGHSGNNDSMIVTPTFNVNDVEPIRYSNHEVGGQLHPKDEKSAETARNKRNEQTCKDSRIRYQAKRRETMTEEQLTIPSKEARVKSSPPLLQADTSGQDLNDSVQRYIPKNYEEENEEDGNADNGEDEGENEGGNNGGGNSGNRDDEDNDEDGEDRHDDKDENEEEEQEEEEEDKVTKENDTFLDVEDLEYDSNIFNAPLMKQIIEDLKVADETSGRELSRKCLNLKGGSTGMNPTTITSELEQVMARLTENFKDTSKILRHVENEFRNLNVFDMLSSSMDTLTTNSGGLSILGSPFNNNKGFNTYNHHSEARALNKTAKDKDSDIDSICRTLYQPSPFKTPQTPRSYSFEPKDKAKTHHMETISPVKSFKFEPISRNSVRFSGVEETMTFTEDKKVREKPKVDKDSKKGSHSKEEEIKSLLEEAVCQQSIIVQTSNALNKWQPFKGRPDAYIEAERLLLAASETYALCIKKVKEVKKKSSRSSPPAASSTATLTLSDIRLPLDEKLVSFLQNEINSEEVFHFIMIANVGPSNFHNSEVITANAEAGDKSSITVPTISLQNIPRHFTLTIKVFYMQNTSNINNTIARLRRQLQLCTTGNKDDEENVQAVFRKSSFKLAGEMRLALDSMKTGSAKYVLDKTITKKSNVDPLAGIVEMSIERLPNYSPGRSGFLTFLEDISGQPAWKTRWCRLDELQLSYWKQPELHHNNKPLGVINLQMSKNKTVTVVPHHACARPHTLEVVLVRARRYGDEGGLMRSIEGGVTETKWWLSCDSKEDRIAWSATINQQLYEYFAWK